MLVNRTMGGGGFQAGLSFVLPMLDSGSGAVNTTPSVALGSAAATFTRAGANAYTRNSSGAWIGPIGANVARSYYSAAGIYLGYLAEGSRTNHFLNSNAPVTQTSASLGTGSYTLWMEGSGSVAVSANTATITGAGAATAGNPVTFSVTGAGTVDYTVTGTPTIVQSENGAFASSYIQTAGASVTRNADVLTYAFAGNASETVGAMYAEASTFRPTNVASAFFIVSFAAAGTSGPLVQTNPASNTTIRCWDGTTQLGKGGIGDLGSSSQKVASSWGGSGMSVTGSGLAVATAAFDGNIDSTGMGIGCNTSGGNSWFGTIRNVKIWTQQLANAQLQALTT